MKVEIRVLQLVGALEERNRCRYTFTDIADAAGLSRHTVRKLMTGETKAVDLETMGKLLDFFAAEGMPITVFDLFTVTPVTPER